MDTKVNVLRQVKIDGNWLRLPVAKVGDRWDWTKVLLDGEPIVALEGTFYLEYRENGKRLRRGLVATCGRLRLRSRPRPAC